MLGTACVRIQPTRLIASSGQSVIRSSRVACTSSRSLMHLAACLSCGSSSVPARCRHVLHLIHIGRRQHRHGRRVDRLRQSTLQPCPTHTDIKQASRQCCLLPCPAQLPPTTYLWRPVPLVRRHALASGHGGSDEALHRPVQGQQSGAGVHQDAAHTNSTHQASRASAYSPNRLTILEFSYICRLTLTGRCPRSCRTTRGRSCASPPHGTCTTTHRVSLSDPQDVAVTRMPALTMRERA